MTPPRSWDSLRIATLELLLEENYAVVREIRVNNPTRQAIMQQIRTYQQEYEQRTHRVYVPKTPSQERCSDGWEGDLENQ